jgi:hypothetical protein
MKIIKLKIISVLSAILSLGVDGYPTSQSVSNIKADMVNGMATGLFNIRPLIYVIILLIILCFVYLFSRKWMEETFGIRI